jgi:serine/threonine-protein kinase
VAASPADARPALPVRPKTPTKTGPAAPSPLAPSDRAAPPDGGEAAPEGYLTLDTVPWTTVYLGRKKLGETPLVKVPVPSGELELVLVNATEGVRESYVARVKPGEVFRTRLDLR